MVERGALHRDDFDFVGFNGRREREDLPGSISSSACEPLPYKRRDPRKFPYQ